MNRVGCFDGSLPDESGVEINPLPLLLSRPSPSPP
jgi:hypothetical protein